jgi:hypothetical protein
MRDPFRLRLLKAITDQLKTVTIANGYDNDLSDYSDENGILRERVFRGRTMFGESDPIPLVSILEDPRVPDGSSTGASGGKTISKLRLLIQGFVSDDIAHPTDNAVYLSADCIEALVAAKRDKTNILGMGGRVTAMVCGTPVHRPADNEVSDTCYFLFGLTLTITEDLENPRA